MEQAERTTKETYESLDEEAKLKAILGTVMEPVTKAFAIELSGIPYSDLDDEKRLKVDNVFSSEGVELTEGEEVKHRLNDDNRATLSETVDMKTVHGAIANKMLKSLGLDD